MAEATGRPGSMAATHPTSLECLGEGAIHRRSSLSKTPSPKKFSVTFNSAVTEVRPRDAAHNSQEDPENAAQRELDLLEVLERDEVLVRCLEDAEPGSRGSICRMRSPEPPPHDDDDDDEGLPWGKQGPVRNPLAKQFSEPERMQE